MHSSDLQTAVRAAIAIASAAGLIADDAAVLRNSDKVMLRLLPCDVVARIEHEGRGCAAFEVELAQRLADTRSPAVALEPRVEPRVYHRDGFAVTLWTYYEALPSDGIAPDEYADALERLHAGMRDVDMPTPHFTDRAGDALSTLADTDRSPELEPAGRELLNDTLRRLTSAIQRRGAPEQVLHGEPHPGNLLRTRTGLVFIDLEACCRGPVEFDIAHAVTLSGTPIEEEAALVGERYTGADMELVRECVVLMLAMITTWRWDRNDQLPDGRRLGVEWLGELEAARQRLGIG
jgi:hypothetical protein